MAKQKSDKDVHQLEIEIVTLNEHLKAWKLLGTSVVAILVGCLSAFFGITQHNLSTKVDEAIKQTALKVDEAIKQTALKEATQLATKYAKQAEVSANKAKEYEKEASQSAGNINDLYKPELDKLTKLNKLIDSDSRTMQLSRLKLGEKWSLSGVGDHYGNDHYLRLMNSADTELYGGFAAHWLWSKNGHVEGSDITYKKSVAPLNNSLEKIKLLRAIKFRLRDSENENDFKIGLIAQEVEKVFPEVVSIGPDGKKGINYSALIAPLINSIQEQNRIIEKQNKRISSLEKRLAQQVDVAGVKQK